MTNETESTAMRSSCCQISEKLGDLSRLECGTVADQLNAIVKALGEIQSSLETTKQARVNGDY
jgi:hypothetical protein